MHSSFFIRTIVYFITRTNRVSLNHLTSMPTQPDPISRRIKAIRAEKGISQTDLAQKIGVERSNYHRLENRGEKLAYELLDRIATALDVSVIDLLTDQEFGEAATEPGSLARRVTELEDRLRDKQQIIDSLEVTTRFIQKRIYDILFATAQELRLASWPDPGPTGDGVSYRNLLSADSWGAEQVHETGESVLIFGNPEVFLRADELLQIYKHLDTANPDYFNLFTTLEHASHRPAPSLIRRTLQAYLLSKLPPQQRDRLFKDGYLLHPDAFLG